MSLSVLFVCMGNICRSPTAEAVFLDRVKSAGLTSSIRCDSAGTIGFHTGSRADGRMRKAASERGYDLRSIARQVRPDDLERFDWILAMDKENLRDLKALEAQHGGKARIRLMCEFARNHPEEEVPDPYYGGERGFVHVIDLLEDACDGLLDALKTELGGDPT